MGVKRLKAMEEENEQLLDSFDKSEYIRQQQKSLILQLKNQITQLNKQANLQVNKKEKKKKKNIIDIK